LKKLREVLGFFDESNKQLLAITSGVPLPDDGAEDVESVKREGGADA